MSDEIFLGGKTYVSSKRAATATGYAQDYIGQLARSGIIDAQRVGGLWYVFLDSLEAYKRNAEAFTPQAPQSNPAHGLETVVSFDGKDYISSSKAAKLTGYNPDYVGQLARSGKVLSRQIGNRWYIEREGLLAHKTQKDSLLASVQAEAAGLVKSTPPVSSRGENKEGGPYLTYIREDDQLFPSIAKQRLAPSPEQTIPIRILPPATQIAASKRSARRPSARSRAPGKTISIAAKTVAALTVVVVLSYGLVSLKSGSTYAFFDRVDVADVSHNEMLASVSTGLDRTGAFIESLITSELTYVRAQ